MTLLVRFAFVAVFLTAISPMAGAGAPQSQGDQSPRETAKAPEEKIDINSASLEQLTKVPGMTRI